jgi:hypothetical protein
MFDFKIFAIRLLLFSSQEIALALESDDPLWPANVSLAEFVNGVGSKTLTQIIAEFFRGQEQAVGNLQGEIMAHAVDLESVISDFSDHFDLGQTNFDSNFIRLVIHTVLSYIKLNLLYNRDNYLQLAVYYNELRYESVEQQEAYDIGTFLGECSTPHPTLLTVGYSAGEVAGYLLLGGRCITLIELLDLLLYNCCCKRSKSKNENMSAI